MSIRRFDAFTLDLDSGELRKGDSPIKLHPQPAQLLNLLVNRPGELVSREEIQKTLWPDDTFVDYDASINSCVRQIRTALEDDAEKPRFIETVPKKGYRFIAPVETADEPSRRKRWLLPATAAIAIALVVWLLWPFGGEDVPSEKPKVSIAVLYFENASGDPELDWLRTGLTEMLVTDLSQIPDVAVVSTNRLFQILKGLEQQDEQVFSADVVREVSERAQTDKVIQGSFMKAGDRIRIDIQVLDPASAEILTTEKVEGEGESSLFAMVDDLSLHVRDHLGPPVNADFKKPRLEELTTHSIEAFRYWSEAGNMVLQNKSSEALAFYEKAIEEDPGFAEALRGASIMHSNLGHQEEAWEYANRALEHMDRLNPLEQLRHKAWTYAMKEETYGLAIDACQQILKLEPDDRPRRHWMARRLSMLERLDEAIEHWEWMRERKHPGSMMYGSLANAYTEQGRFGKAEEVSREYIERFPDRSAGYQMLGETLTRCGRLDEALEMFEKQEVLSPGTIRPYDGRFNVYVLRDSWNDAETAARKMGASSDPFWQTRSRRLLARIKLFHGQSDDALESFGPNGKAQVLLAKDQPARALEKAREAQVGGRGQYAEWEGIFLESLALGRLGRMDEAQKAADRLLERTAAIPTEKEKRRHHHLLGELALLRGDTVTAIRELEQAQSMLLPRGFPGDHVPIWFALGSAYLSAGEEDKALSWFERVEVSTNEHLLDPIPYVRSFYFLGKIHESRGEMEKARESYRRFYEFWKDGDLDREQVEEARRKITS